MSKLTLIQFILSLAERSADMGEWEKAEVLLANAVKLYAEVSK
jgi:hypothetical protein